MELRWADEDMGSNIGEALYKEKEFKIYEYNGYQGDIEERNKAWEIYIDLWGESDCLELDKNNNWIKKECNDCGMCGI